MSLIQWLRNLSRTPKARTKKPMSWRTMPAGRRRLGLERLEDRLAPAINVAVVGTGGLSNDSGFQAIVTQLNASTLFNATLVAPSQVATVSQLNSYNAVVIGNNGLDPNTGDQFAVFASALRTWVQGGGGVVATGSTVYGTQGDPGAADIDAVVPVATNGNYNPLQAGTLQITNAGHPVTAGLSNITLTGGDYLELPVSGPDGGATVLATANGVPDVVVGTPGSGRGVYLGPIYASPSSNFNNNELRSGSADRLLKQAVIWAANVNLPPTATNDSYTVGVNSGPNRLNVRANDSDPNGDLLTLSAVTQPLHGSAIIDGSRVTYVPTANYSGSDSFTYTVSDGQGGSASATVNLNVTGTQAPLKFVAVIGTGDDDRGMTAIVNQLNDHSFVNNSYATLVQPGAVTADLLANYDVAVIGNDGNSPSTGDQFSAFASPLRTWVQGGGGLIATGWTILGTAGDPAQATIDAIVPVVANGNYGAIQAGNLQVVAAHPITNGISGFTLSGRDYFEYPQNGIDGGAQTLALANGQPVVVVGSAGLGKTVYLGPVYSGSAAYNTSELRSGPADRLLEQAVAWVQPDTTPPIVTGVSPNLSQSVPDSLTQISVSFSEAVTGGSTAANYDLRSAGADNQFDTPDDVVVPVTASNGLLTFAPLAAGQYRFTVTDSIKDIAGNALDGDANGIAGGSYVRTFTVVNVPPTVTGVTPDLSHPLADGFTTINVNFSEPVVGAGSASNYELRSAGADNQFNTGDDTLIPLTPTATSNSTLLSFAAMPAGLYRLTVMGTITDRVGNALDGGNNGTAGVSYVRDFSVVNVPPTVVSTSVLGNGTLAAGTTTLQVNFSENVVGADQPSNFQLQSTGPNGLLGEPTSNDDVIVPVSASYSGNTATLTFAGLAEGVYRLTVRGTITDAVGNPLAGTGTPGSDFFRDFVVMSTPATTLTSPNGFTFDPAFGGFAAGQLVQGTNNAFDGLNRLQVAGNDYSPTINLTPVALVTEARSSSNGTAGGWNRFATDTILTQSNPHLAVQPSGSLTYTGSSPSALTVDASFLMLGPAGSVGQIRFMKNGVQDKLFETAMGSTWTQLHVDDYIRVNPNDVIWVEAFNPGNLAYESSQSVLRVTEFPNLPVTRPTALVTEARSSSNGTAGGWNRFATDTILTQSNPHLAVQPSGSLTYTGSSPSALTLDASFLMLGPAGSVGQIRFMKNGVQDKLFETAMGSTWTQLHVDDYIRVNPNDVIWVEAFNPGNLAYESSQSVLRVTEFPNLPVTGPTALVTEARSSSNGTAGGWNRFATDTILTQSNPHLAVQPSGSLTYTGSSPSALTLDASFLMLGPAGSVGLIRFMKNGVQDKLFETAMGRTWTQLHVDDYIRVNPNDVIWVEAFNPGNLAYESSQSVLRVTEFPVLAIPALADGQKTVVTPTQSIAGLSVSRAITVPNTGSQDFARTVDSFQNTTGNSITTAVHVVGNLGSDAATRVFATSDGDTTVDPNDQWFGTDGGPGTPALIHFVHGPAGLKPDSVSVIGDNVEWTYTITVQPGQTLDLATFTIQASTEANAIAEANALVTPNGFSAAAAQFLTPAQVRAIANFQDTVPPTVVNTTPSLNGALERVGNTSIHVNFSEPVVGADVASNFQLLSGGPDQILGTGDDVTLTLTTAYANNAATLSFADLPVNQYRLTVKQAITDLAGNALGSGSDFVRNFSVVDTTPPTVTSVTPSMATGTLPAGTTSIQVNFSEPIVGGATAANFELRSQGPDGLLGTTDDRLVPITPSYSGTTATLNFAGLPAGVYRLIIQNTITDPSGNALVPLTRDFVVTNAPTIRFNLSATVPLAGAGGVSVKIADFNGDGIPDVVIANFNSNSISVALGNGSGGLGAFNTFSSQGSNPITTAVADFNGDGKLDIAVGDRGLNSVVIFTGDGRGNFSYWTTIGVSSPQSIAAGDLNHDGHPDLVVASIDFNSVSIFLNNGNGSFYKSATVSSGGSQPSALAVGDLNGDGNLDVVVGNSGPGNSLTVLFGDGSGFIRNTTSLNPGASRNYADGIVVADFNHDGKLDIASLNSGAAVGVLLGNGGGGFSSPSVYNLGTQPNFGSLVAADFNGDGNLDLAAVDTGSNQLTILQGSGTGAFSLATNLARPGHASDVEAIAAGDLNNDGKTDLAVVDFNGGLELYSNTTDSPFAPTSPNGYTFDVGVSGFGAGQLIQGTNNAFDGLNRLQVNGVDFSPASSSLIDGKRTLLTTTQTLSGLTVSRAITVPNTGSQDFARTVDYYQNPTSSPITTTVHVVGNLGSDAATRVFATSSGNPLSVNDQWFGTDGGPGTTAIVHYVHSPYGLKPDSIDVVGDNVEWTYTITVQPGQTLDLATFTIQAGTEANAIAEAAALVTPGDFGGRAGTYLTQADRAALANFVFPPTLTVPRDQTFEATSAAGAAVTFAGATATDPASTPVITYSPAPGSRFALGSTTVTATATDAAGLTATGQFHVIVMDTTPPTLTLPPDQSFEATGGAGATVHFAPATATDAVTASPTITYTVNGNPVTNDSPFALGTTTVTVTAADAAGNTSTGTFRVTVKDTTPPLTAILTGPAALTNSPAADFTFGGSDLVTPAASLAFAYSLDGASYAPVTGNALSLSGLADGGHTLLVRATDLAGNTDPNPASYAWTIDSVAPSVKDVRVEWGTRSASLGSVPSGVLPWSNIKAFDIVFTKDVVVTAGDLSLVGVRVASYGFSDFSYDPATHTARWVLATPLNNDSVSLTLDGHSTGGVRDQAGNLLAGGDYARLVKALAGDVTGDGRVDASDLVRIRNKFTTAGVAYDPLYDINGDGVVDINDYVAARANLGRSL